MITPSFNLSATAQVLPKLALDFTTAVLDSRITFTRIGATATRVNSSGFMETVAANTPRFDFNPTTLACRGLLIEEARDNKFIDSQNFSTINWTKSRSSINANAAISPDGTNNALSLIEDTTASNSHYFYYAVSAGWATGTYTMSIYIKAISTNRRVTLYQGFGGVAGSYVTFDPNTGTIAGTGGSATGTMTAAGNGWYRCSITYTTTSTTARFDIALNTAASVGLQLYTGDGTSGVYVWGAQLEAGAFPTSYIPTTTTALTRNADVATMTGTNFSDWFNATEGTFVVNGSTFNFTNSDVIVDATDGTTSNRIQMYVAGVTGAATTFMATGGATQAQFSAGTVTANTTFTFASGYKVNAIAASLNAATPATDTSATMPSGINATTLGCRFNGVNQLNGYLRKVNYYPQRLTNAEIQAFSK